MADKTKSPEEIAAALTDLQQKYDALNKAHQDLQADKTELEKSSAEEIGKISDELTGLQTKHDELTTAHAELQSKHEELEQSSAEEIGKLSDELSQATKAAANGYLSIKVDGNNYKVIGKNFRIDKVDISVEDLIKNEDLVKELIAKGSGIFVLLDV